MKTDHEKEYEFNFTIRSPAKPGFNSFTTQIMKVKILCGAEIQSISETNLTFIFAQEEGSTFINFFKNQTNNLFVPTQNQTYPNIRSIFESDIKACDISKFDLFNDNSFGK